MTEALYLNAGDPASEPATFTRFVVPFAYSLEPWDGPAPDDGRRYRCQCTDPDRKRYLTRETAEGLFARARWLRLEADSGRVETHLDVPRYRHPEHPIPVRLGAPRLVLFEWAAQRPQEPTPEEPDMLATGFLLVDAWFPDQDRPPDVEDLLELNEVFRCLSPPYPDHRARLERLVGDHFKSTDEPASSPPPADPHDPYLSRWEGWLDHPVEGDGCQVLRLFPRAWLGEAKAAIDGTSAPGASPGWSVYADHRAFVWTCAVAEGGLAGLQRKLGTSLEASAFVPWVRLLQVDRPTARPEDLLSASPFEITWTDERTYDRWAYLGSLYGFSYHSGAAMIPPCEDPRLWRHFAGIYFDQVLLLLYLRVSCFRFSDRLSRLTGAVRGEDGDGAFGAAFRDLRRDFAHLTNLYRFPLVSNQQQGIELYGLARRSMDIEELFREIQAEIDSTHELVQVEAAHRLDRLAVLLTLVAAVGGVVAVAAGIVGMNLLIEPLGRLWRPEPTPLGELGRALGLAPEPAGVTTVLALDAAAVLVVLALSVVFVLILVRWPQPFLRLLGLKELADVFDAPSRRRRRTPR